MGGMPKGQKPGQANPQQGFAPNAYQQASQSTGGGYPQQGNNPPPPSGPSDYQTSGHPYAPGNTNY